MDGRNKILKNKVFLTFNFGLGPPEGGLLEGMGEVLETPVGVLEEGLCRTPGQGARLQTRTLFLRNVFAIRREQDSVKFAMVRIRDVYPGSLPFFAATNIIKL